MRIEPGSLINCDPTGDCDTMFVLHNCSRSSFFLYYSTSNNEFNSPVNASGMFNWLVYYEVIL